MKAMNAVRISLQTNKQTTTTTKNNPNKQAKKNPNSVHPEISKGFLNIINWST